MTRVASDDKSSIIRRISSAIFWVPCTRMPPPCTSRRSSACARRRCFSCGLLRVQNSPRRSWSFCTRRNSNKKNALFVCNYISPFKHVRCPKTQKIYSTIGKRRLIQTGIVLLPLTLQLERGRSIVGYNQKAHMVYDLSC